MLNAVNLSFVAFARSLGSMDGQVIVFFVMTVAAAEAAVGLAIILQLFRIADTVNADEVVDPAMVNHGADGARRPTDLLRWIVILPALGFLWNADRWGAACRGPRKLRRPGRGAGGAFVVARAGRRCALHGRPSTRPLHDRCTRGSRSARFDVDVAFRLDALIARS